MASEGERRSKNRKLAETLASAGIYVFPSADNKVPLVLQWQRADTAIGTDGAEEARAEARARAEAAGKEFDENTYVGATINISTIKRLWRQHKDAIPSISLGPSGLFVADCDVDLKRNGPKLFRQWCVEQGIDISKCPVTRSQSGGEHIFFKGTDLRSHVGPTLDALYVQAKAIGGQVIAPGAWRTDDRRYLPLPDHPPLASTFATGDVPPIPAPLLKLQSERSTSNVADADLAPIIAEMSGELPDIDFDPNKLARDTGDCSKSRYSLALDLARQHGDTFTPALYAAAIQAFDPAGELVDGRPSRGEYDLRQLAREFSKAKAEVTESERRQALAFGDLTDTMKAALLAVEAARDRNEDPGAEIERLKAALDTDDDATAEDVSAVYALETAYIVGSDMSGPIARLKRGSIAAVKESARTGRGYTAESAMFANIELTAWTIDQILPERGIGFIVGASHTGKTFACLDIMGHLAQGRDWFDRKVYEPTCSLYIGGEDVEEIPGRIKGWTLKNGSTLDRVGVMDAPPNLATDLKAIKTIVQVVKHLKADTGLRCGLIVLDTVASLAVGMKENTAEEVGQLTDLMRRIGKATGSAVLGVHHPKKGADTSEGRGSGAFYNNATFEFRLVKKKGARRGAFQIHKNKFAAIDAAGLPFQLDPVEIGTNRHGKAVSTLVFRKADACDFPAAVEDDDEIGADDVLPPSQEVLQPQRGQDRVLSAAKRAIAAQGGPVKRAAITVEIDADDGTPLSGNSIGPLIARLVNEGALLRVGPLSYGLP